MDKRLAILKDWLSKDLDLSLTSIEPASADASFRRYFRATISKLSASKQDLPTTFIIMDSPPEHEDNALFIRCATALQHRNLNVPRIFHAQLQLGFLLISDLGTQVYQQSLNPQSVNSLYKDSFAAMIRMQKKAQENDSLLDWIDTYTHEKLTQEMNLFNDWYIQKYHRSQLDENEEYLLTQVMNLLVNSAIEQPQVLVHRDFHCRNLLVTNSNNPGIIDFQDMLIGPITYDLVSLLKDCYIQWPTADIEKWALDYQTLSRQNDLHQHSDPKQWLKWFDWMGVQRHLKVLGIFSRLYFRDGKDQYLNDIPLTYAYLLETCQRYPELSGLEKILKKYSLRKLNLSPAKPPR